MSTSSTATKPSPSDGATHDPPPGTAPHPKAVRALLRLYPYARPALPSLIGSTIAASLAMLCGLAFPLVIQRIIDGPVTNGDLAGLWPLGALLLGLGVTEAALFLLRRMLATRPTMRVEAAMRDAFYQRLQALPVSFHDRWSAGQLMSRAVSDLSTIRRFLAFGIVFLVVNVFTFLVGVGILLTLSWQLGIIVAGLAVPLIGLCYLYEARYQTLARRSQDQVGDLATVVEESVLGIRVLKSFGRSGYLTGQFLDQARNLRRTELAKASVISRLWAVIVAIPEVAFGLTLFLGVVYVANDTVSAGTLVAFFGVALGLRWPIDSIGWLLAVSNDAASASNRFFEVMDEPVTVTSPASPRPLPSPARGHLKFCGARFRFDSSEPRRAGAEQSASPELLRGIDLDVAPGETIALVGATGSGKSTLTALVNRLYDVTGGAITLDGVDIRELDLKDLRRSVSMAFEEPTLFSASVRENVLLGFPDGTDDDVRRALGVAQADFVEDLPWGLDTRIGEQGLSLSGGQRQRLALARAVVGRPSVLVFDDPLSALDIHTEAQVERALRSVLRGTTALIVAHRASTVLLADRVALLAHGRVAAVGTHSELMATVPEYRALLASSSDEPGRDEAGSVATNLDEGGGAR
jgi:ATP-binding cassette, subfamily B, bacterial